MDHFGKPFLHMFSHNSFSQKCQTVLKLEHVEAALRRIIASHNKGAHECIAGTLLGCNMSLETKDWETSVSLEVG